MSDSEWILQSDSEEDILIKEVIVSEDVANNIRVDSFISDEMGLCSRSQVRQRVVRVVVNGKVTKLSKKVKAGDKVSVFYSKPRVPRINGEDIELNVIYEDRNVLVINKPQGMVVHPAPGNYSGTIANALMYRYWQGERKTDDNRYVDKTGLSNSMDSFGRREEFVRPGIVHRLDKETSGVLITAKNMNALEFLANEFRNRRVKKIYIAIVKGIPPKRKGRIDNRIVRDKRNRKRFTSTNNSQIGKRAITDYWVIKTFKDGYSMLLLRPRTGRTHQLRVHMRFIRCPILGDSVYSRKDKKFPSATLMLHAYKLWIRLPGDNKLLENVSHDSRKDNDCEVKKFRAPLPNRFKEIIKQLSE